MQKSNNDKKVKKSFSFEGNSYVFLDLKSWYFKYSYLEWAEIWSLFRPFIFTN